jgi:N-acetylneuraminic acid mutarotase
MMLCRLPLVAVILLPFAVGVSLEAREGSAKLPPLPVPASSLGTVECGGFLYVYGGHMAAPHTYSNETTSGKLHRLDLGDPKAEWEELPGGTHLQGMNLAAHKGKVIRVGGMEPRNKKGEKPTLFSTDEASVYDPKAKKWGKLPGLPEPRSSHDLVVIGNRLFVVGGWKLGGKGTSGEWLDTALVLDLAAAKPEWKSFPQPFKRRALTAVAHNGKVYVLGGLTADGPAKNVDFYDPATEKWSTGPEYPGSDRAGFSPAACVHTGRLYLNTADGDVLRLKEKGDGWEEAGKVPTPRIVHRLVPWGDSILVVGGAGEKGNVGVIEVVSVSGKK